MLLVYLLVTILIETYLIRCIYHQSLLQSVNIATSRNINTIILTSSPCIQAHHSDNAIGQALIRVVQ